MAKNLITLEVSRGSTAGWHVRHPAWSLLITRGPDRKRERTIRDVRAVIGSAPAADLSLSDRTVSALHCELTLTDRGIRVRDLGSKNGTRLFDRVILEAYVESGDVLVLGHSTVRIKLLDEVEERPLAPRTNFGELRGGSPAMRQLYSRLALAAASDEPVLLQGETGTGKQLAADALVSEGLRADKPFVVVDCGALPPELADSELFGHEAGAFTGAERPFAGAFERANGGTLFLDEVGELPPHVQTRLLGVLERKAFKRVGGTQMIPVDVRVIAATHRELGRDVNSGSFRADLYYRLAVLGVRLPPLRERTEDIPELVTGFLEEMNATLSPAVLQRLYHADYPGNVRELRAAVLRAVVGVDAVPAPWTSTRPLIPWDFDAPFRPQKERAVADLERSYIQELIERCQGNLSEVARRSGINRVYLYALLDRLGLRHRRGGA